MTKILIEHKLHKQNKFHGINRSMEPPSPPPLCFQCKVEHADESAHKVFDVFAIAVQPQLKLYLSHLTVMVCNIKDTVIVFVNV